MWERDLASKVGLESALHARAHAGRQACSVQPLLPASLPLLSSFKARARARSCEGVQLTPRSQACLSLSPTP